MKLSKLIGNYASFNEWANHKIVIMLSGLDRELVPAVGNEYPVELIRNKEPLPENSVRNLTD